MNDSPAPAPSARSGTAATPRRRSGRLVAVLLATAVLLPSPAAPAIDAAEVAAAEPLVTLAPATGVDPTAAASPKAAPAASPKTTITADLPASITISRYGTRTKAKLKVTATGKKLRYTWQVSKPGSRHWKKLKKGTSATLTVTTKWRAGTKFRVVVTGTKGKAVSRTTTLKVLQPSLTPAADAQAKFGLTGLRQGVDLSAYQAGASIPTIAAWAGNGGVMLLRTASGARPVRTDYVSLCTGAKGNTGRVPVVEDCAYRGFAKAARAKRLRIGHYWFNGWIDSTDPTANQVFANGYTVVDSARDFVAWLIADGGYTKTSTDPLVLDIENGRAWTSKSGGKKYTASLRAWNPQEATAFLQTVRQLLTGQGYQANLYVYMSANAASRRAADGSYVWAPLAGSVRLWVASWGTDNGRVPDKLPATGPWQTWSIWQYSSNLRIPGSRAGALDADLVRPHAWTPLELPQPSTGPGGWLTTEVGLGRGIG
ncbi:MAG: GH25 family lysozyme [Propionicimonas sp.]|nr:GH25 family lysozyme [Propionicimonas sp.]